MKELLLFSFVLVFIACQNQPQSSVTASAPTAAQTLGLASSFEAMSCAISEEPALDPIQQLADSENPGFYYREVPLRSELSTDGDRAELVCISSVTDSPADESMADQKPDAFETRQEASAPEENEDRWTALTDRWKVAQEQNFCEDKNASLENPACQELQFTIETGKLFSESSENSLASL